ncbi:hypothetical protein EASAB2608_00163 [Streptomyces sp. EAS-AB2608]|nr:hypothetical protein EASAB2608_00163 [Streptomyces sp. EAS-AB2608]CUW32748.1 hypothetical protein TUE45_pSRTUE45c_0116 [Streptomyces reticuli]
MRHLTQAQIGARVRSVLTAASENRLSDREGRWVGIDAILRDFGLQGYTEADWGNTFTNWDEYVVRSRPGPGPRWPALPPEPGAPVADPVLSLICGDWHTGTATHRQAVALWATSRRLAPTVFGNHMHLDRAAMCAGWPAPVNNPQRPLRAPGAPPALTVNALLDVSTPTPRPSPPRPSSPARAC